MGGRQGGGYQNRMLHGRNTAVCWCLAVIAEETVVRQDSSPPCPLPSCRAHLSPWLVHNPQVTKTPNAENPWVHGSTPILTMDVW